MHAVFWNFSWVFNSSADLLVSLMSFLSMCPSIHFPCLCQLTAVNDKMAEYTNTPGTASLNAALMHTLQRHRDILQVCPLIHVNFPPFILLAYLFSIVLMYLTLYLLFSEEIQFGKATLIN